MCSDKIQNRRGSDRRQIPDRRSGKERRLNGSNSANGNDDIFNTQQACRYLRISRPTFLKYIATGRIKAIKIGRGWRVFKSELDRLLRPPE
jgi:excisionase family DNA binding protein